MGWVVEKDKTYSGLAKRHLGRREAEGDKECLQKEEFK